MFSITICLPNFKVTFLSYWTKIVSDYDQEIPQSQTIGKPMAPRGRAKQQSQDTSKTNQAKQPALSIEKFEWT